MKLKKKRIIIIIYGRTGSGKTNLTKYLIKEYCKENDKRIIIIDPQYEYAGEVVVYNYLDFIDYVTDKKEFKIVCRFENDIDYNYLFDSIYEIGKCLLVVEEIEIYINPKSENSKFNYLVRYGRHRDISIIGVARRISELNINFRSQVNYIFTFKQIEKRDLMILSEMGFNENEIKNLPEYKFKVLSY